MIDRIQIPDFLRSILFGWEGPSTFSILMMIAFLAGSFILPREYKRRGLIPEVADMVVFLGVIGTLVGAKIFFIFEIWDQIFIEMPGFSGKYIYPFTHWYGFPNQPGFWSSLFSGGGLVFYGGFLFGALFIYIYFKWNKLNTGSYFDGMAPTMALGYAIGRLGCFVSGDGCYGYHTDLKIPLLVFQFDGAHPSGVPVWNTPVIESIISFIFFLYFHYHARFQNYKNWGIFWQYIILHGTARLMIEFLRVNKAVFPFLEPPKIVNIPDPSGNPIFLSDYYWHGFSQSQYISLLFIGFGLFFTFRFKLLQKNKEQF